MSQLSQFYALTKLYTIFKNNIHNKKNIDIETSVHILCAL